MTREEAIKELRDFIGQLTEGCQEIIKILVPELRESEDERILASIADCVGLMGEDGNVFSNHNVTKVQVLSWLEKQKETLHISETCKENPDSFIDEDERIRKSLVQTLQLAKRSDGKLVISNTLADKYLAYLEKQKEQTEELSTRLNGLMQEYVKAGKDEEEQEHRLKCYQLFWDALGDSEFFKQEEQKLHLTVKGNGVYKICPHCKSRMIRDDSKVYTSMPPQYGYNCPKCGTMEFDTVMYDNPEMEEQKPAEWSEEDEKVWQDIFDLCNRFGYDDACRKLKSLRPPQYCENCKLKRSVENWKPSEAQMRALNEIICLGEISYVGQEEELIALRNKLKKLM